MASDDEDEELAALRFAALASMKTKKNPFEEDPDLKALKETALRTLENTTFTPSVPQGMPPYLPGSLPHPAQSYSPNYYSAQSLPPPQYVLNQYSQPPPAFRGSSNYYLYPQQQQQQQQQQPQQRNFDQHPHHRQAFNIQHQQQYKSRPGRGRSGPGSTGRRRGGAPGSRGGTPPNTTTPAHRGSSSRGPSQHGNPPPGAPPRANNLILINPLAPHGGTADQGGDVGQRGRGPGSTSAAAPLLLRPQDKWSGASDSTSQTASPSRPKATGKFSRFENSGSETEESESEDETTPMNKSTDRVDSDLSDAESEEENEEIKESKSSDTDNDDDGNNDNDNNDDDSVASEVEMDTGDNDDDKDAITDVVDKHAWSESESAMSSDDGVDTKDTNEGEKTGSIENRESETEEEKREKQERKETDRLLEESIDQRHVHDTSSEIEESNVPKWTTQNMQEMAPEVTVSRNSFDLSHKLAHRRAMMKDQNAEETAVCDLSEKLKNRKNRPPNVADTVVPVSSVAKDSGNVRISEIVPDPDKAGRTTMSEADLKRFEARKRKFGASPLSTDSRKTTISLKGIVPRPKKRSKERAKSQSPIPKRYSRDLERFEKKRIRRKSSSKEIKEPKSSHNDSKGKERSELKAKHKVTLRRKSVDAKKAKSEADVSDASKSDVSVQISDDSDEEGGRAWKKEGNKSKIVFNKDKARPIRDSLEPVRFDSRPRRNYPDRLPSQSDRYGDRRQRFGDRPDSRFGRDRLVDERRKDRGGGSSSGGRRSVKVMEESDSDSDGPRLLSSVVLPGGRPQSDKHRGVGVDEESTSSHDSSLGHSHGAKKRMVVSTVAENPKRGSRKVTAEFDSHRTSSIRAESENGNQSQRTDKYAPHDLSALSVTVDSDIPMVRSRESVHKRLGRQLAEPDSKEDENAHKSKRKLSDEKSSTVVDESAQGDSNLEQRIQRIKEKNAAILKRQEEVRQDKERYG